MDKNTAIGIVLIVLCFWAYLELNKPSQAELDQQQAIRDSIELAQQQKATDEIASDRLEPKTKDSIQEVAPGFW